MDQEGLCRKNGVHVWLEMRQNDLQHLVYIARVEVTLGRLGDVEVYRREVFAVSAELTRMREELVVQSIV